MHPQRAADGAAPDARDEEPADRLRLQHHADVASAAPGRGLRDGGHPDRTGASCSGSAAAITRARWRRSARRCSTRPANRELFEEQVDIIFKAFNEESFSHKGKHYTLPPEVPYRGYTLKELTLVPRPLRLPVEMLAADPGRHAARAGFHGQARHPGRDRRRFGRGRCDAQGRAGLAGGACARMGKQIELGERLCFGFQFYMADSGEQGIRTRGEILRREHEDVRRAAPGAAR